MSRKEQENDVDHVEVKRFYDGEYYAAVSERTRPSWHTRRIASRLGSLQGKTALDIACGTGEWLAELQRRGATVSGVDISARAVEVCRKRLPGADVREAIAEELPFPSSSFDLVSCLGSLEHFLDQHGALLEMVRVAKPGATVLILVPNAEFLTRRLGLYRGTGQVAVRETVRSINEWEEMLCEAGLTVAGRWRDLHTLSWDWIRRGDALQQGLRALQAASLALWPLRWQYQVYFHCHIAAESAEHL